MAVFGNEPNAVLTLTHTPQSVQAVRLPTSALYIKATPVLFFRLLHLSSIVRGNQLLCFLEM